MQISRLAFMLVVPLGVILGGLAFIAQDPGTQTEVLSREVSLFVGPVEDLRTGGAFQSEVLSREVSLFVGPFEDLAPGVAFQSETLSREVTILIGNLQDLPPGGSFQNEAVSREVTVHIPAPDLVVSNILAPVSANSGETLALQWVLQNVGAGAIAVPPTGAAFQYSIYLSTDSAAGGDILIGTVAANAPYPAPGNSVSQSGSINLSASLSSTSTNYYVVVIADVSGQQDEAGSKFNNTAVSSQPILIHPQPRPDLTVPTISIAPIVTEGEMVPLAHTVLNQGNATANGPWNDKIVLSANATLGDGDDQLFGIYNPGSVQLAAGTSYETPAQLIQIPPGLHGDYFVIVKTDNDNAVTEWLANGETNNITVKPIEIQIGNYPDLSVTEITPTYNGTTPAQFFVNSKISVAWKVTNAGPGTANDTWYDKLYLSDDNILDAGDLLLGQKSIKSILSPGSFYLNSLINLALPSTAGSKYLILDTDTADDVPEGTNNNNNTLPVPIQIVEPSYNATVSTAFLEGVAPKSANLLQIPLAGQAIDKQTQLPVPNVDVTVRIYLKNNKRNLTAHTDAQGNYNIPFYPLTSDAGRFTLYADHPAVETDDINNPQDDFHIINLQIVPLAVTEHVLENAILSKSIAIKNLGDMPVNGIVANIAGGTGYLATTAQAPVSLAASQTGQINYVLTSSGPPPVVGQNTPLALSVKCQANGVEAAADDLAINAYVDPLTPTLQLSWAAGTPSGEIKMQSGAQTQIAFNIKNTGTAPAKDVVVNLPCTPNGGCSGGCQFVNGQPVVDPVKCPTGNWLNLLTPYQVGDIPPGETRAVELALQPKGLDGGTVISDKSIAVNGSNVDGQAIAKNFVVTTTDKGKLKVRVEDELTYYAVNPAESDPNNPQLEGVALSTGTGPLVKNATIQLYQITGLNQKQLAWTGTTGNGVEVETPDLTAGYYELRVTAAKHKSHQSLQIIDSNTTTEITTFLSQEIITYDWKVVPKEIEDVYEITIEATFQTFVPTPIVVVTPTVTEVNLPQPGMETTVIYRVENKGIIAAQGCKFNLESPPGYSFTLPAGFEDIGTLGAKQWVELPVTLKRLPALPSSANPCNFNSGVQWFVICKDNVYHTSYFYFKIPENCGGTPAGGGSGGGGGSSGGPVYVEPSSGGPIFVSKTECQEPPVTSDEEPPPCISTGMMCCDKDPSQNGGNGGAPPPGSGPAGATSGPASQLAEDPTKTDPVVLFSGELRLREEDLRVPGRGFDLVWRRTYRSKIGPKTGLGNGWDFNYNIRMERISQNIAFHTGMGRSLSYAPAAGGSWTSEGSFNEFTKNEDLSYTLTHADTSKWNFNAADGAPAAGKIRSIVDRNGNTMTFTYDATTGNLIKITDTLARDYIISWTTDNKYIQSVTDFGGRMTVYEYYSDVDAGGSAGDLKSVTTPAVTGTPNGNDYPLGKTVTYQYTKGFSIALDRLNHNLISITDGKGQVYVQNEYSTTIDPADRQFDRLTRQTWGNTGDIIDLVYVPQVPQVTNGQTVMTTILNDRVGNVTEYDFDIKNRLIARRDYTGRANADQPTSLTANRPTGKLRATDPAYFLTKYGYNSESLITKVTFPNGNTRVNRYEVDDNPSASVRTKFNLRKSTWAPGIYGGPAEQAEIIELFDYDTDSGGCCGASFLKKYTDPKGNITEYVNDSKGNRLKTKFPLLAGQSQQVEEDFSYNAFGQMTEHILPDNGSGHRRKDVYNYYSSGPENGYLQSAVVDHGALSHTTSYEYDIFGNATKVTDARGNDAQYVFNALNQPVQELSRPAPGRKRYEKRFWYDANNNIERIDVENVNVGLNLTPEVQSNTWLTTTFEYEILNKLKKTTQEVSDSKSVVTEYEYDAVRNRISVKNGVSGATSISITKTEFDERDLPYRVTRGFGKTEASTVQLDYDGNRNVVKTHAGLENTPRISTSTYDAYNRVMVETDPMGNTTTHSYDANGNELEERFEGQLVDVAGSQNNTILSRHTRTFDSWDRVTKEEEDFFDPLTGAPVGDGKASITFIHNNNSQVVSLLDDNGHATLTTYDTANRTKTVTDAKGNVTTYSYDANGNTIQIVELEQSDLGGAPAIFVTSSTYDMLDRLATASDSGGNTSQYFYDSRSNATVVVDPRGNRVNHAFDGMNRLISTTRILTDSGAGGGQASGSILTQQEWDDASRLVKQTDHNNNVTSYVYDALSRRLETVFADGTKQTMSYDVHGNATTQFDANGTQVANTFDLGNRLIHRTVARGTGVVGTTFENFAYDSMGHMVTAIDDDSTVIRTYDSLGNLTRDIQNGAVVAADFNAEGSLTKLYYPSGRIVDNTYDDLDRKKTISDQNGLIANYDYAGAGRVVRRMNGNSTYSTYEYDSARRVNRIVHGKLSGPVYEDRTYTWDAADNKTSQSEAVSNLNVQYEYDSVSRLIKSTRVKNGGAPELIEYYLDGANNRTQVVGGADAGVYLCDSTLPEPGDCEMNQYTSIAGQPISHDKNGNAKNTPALFGMQYDYRNQLVSATNLLGVTIVYQYDAVGRQFARVSSAAPGIVATTHWYQSSPISELHPVDGAADSVVGQLWNETVALKSGSQSYYLHFDHLMSVDLVTDNSGVISENMEYGDFGDAGSLGAFGNLTAQTFRFDGRRFDSDLKLYEVGPRRYDQSSGRFVTRDPKGIWNDDYGIGNASLFAGNNPQTFTDNGYETTTSALSDTGSDGLPPIIAELPVVIMVGPLPVPAPQIHDNPCLLAGVCVARNWFPVINKNNAMGFAKKWAWSYVHCVNNCELARNCGRTAAKDLADLTEKAQAFSCEYWNPDHHLGNMGGCWSAEQASDYPDNRTGRSCGMTGRSCTTCCDRRLGGHTRWQLPERLGGPRPPGEHFIPSRLGPPLTGGFSTNKCGPQGCN